MAKVKLDLKSLEIPSAAQKPLYAGVGATDLAYTTVKEYVADVSKKLTDVQKQVTDFKPSKARKQAEDAVTARREAVEGRVADLQQQAKSFPSKVQATIDENVSNVVDTYTELAKRGESVVKRAPKPSSLTAEVKVNESKPVAKPTAKKAPATKSTAKKSTAKKSPAKKSTAKKSTTKKATAKKATVQASVSTGTTNA